MNLAGIRGRLDKQISMPALYRVPVCFKGGRKPRKAIYESGPQAPRWGNRAEVQNAGRTGSTTRSGGLA
jgi:hypothetical protein